MIDYDGLSYFGEDAIAPQSLGSRELADFEAYNDLVLPLLVEADLQSLIDVEMAPIEQNARNMLVDIVRRCQTVVSQNYHSFQESTSHSSPIAGAQADLSPQDDTQENLTLRLVAAAATVAAEDHVVHEITDAAVIASEIALSGMEPDNAALNSLGYQNGALQEEAHGDDAGYFDFLNEMLVGVAGTTTSGEQ